MDIINSFFSSYTFCSHNVSKISKWQLLWSPVCLIFSHPMSNPSSSHWLHIQSLYITITTSSAWVTITASYLAFPSRLAILPAPLHSAVRQSPSNCETNHVTPSYLTQRENGNPTDLCFCYLSDRISHPSPSLSVSLATPLTIPSTSQTAP